MEYGAHLPLISFSERRGSLDELRDYARLAWDLGYRYLCANDHLLFSRPWLDGPIALASVLDVTGDMRLATTVALPVLRGPVPTAKTLGALDLLSGGRMIAGVGPGSSAADYAAAGFPFDERWKRFDESISALRALWSDDPEGFAGQFYSTEGIRLEPRPAQAGGPPIWVASWGSEAGLRRVARLGDGWLASGYNTTPDVFSSGLGYLGERLEALGRSPEGFPNGIATMWMYVTEDRARADQVLESVIAAMLGRPVDAIRGRLPVGPAEACAALLASYSAAGAQRVFVWPVADEEEQLARFMEEVVPVVEGAAENRDDEARSASREVGEGEPIMYATGGLRVSYLKPTPLNGPVTMVTRLADAGERRTTVEVAVHDQAGEPMATAEVVSVRRCCGRERPLAGEGGPRGCGGTVAAVAGDDCCEGDEPGRNE